MKNYRISTLIVCAAFTCTLNAAVFTWDGGGGSDNKWQTAANWANDTTPDADGSAALVFAGGATKTTANDFPSDTAFVGLTLNNTAAFTLSGNAITLNGPITSATSASAITDTLSLPITLGGELDLTLGSNHGLISSGIIGGAYGLSTSGSGTGNLTLNGLNTYTGQTILNGSGRVYYNTLKNLGEPCSFGAPPTPEAGTISLNSITEYKGGDTASDRNLWFASGVQFFNSGSGTLTLNGGIGGPGSPSIRGTRDIVINGPVTNTSGLSRTDNGTLFLNAPVNTFPGTLGISHGAIVAVTLADSGTACSIGKGTGITLGQTGWETTGNLRYVGTTDASCNRTLRIQSSQLSHGGQLENATAGTTVTFSGAVSTAVGTKPRVDTAIPFWLTGAGNGVMASALPVGLRIIKEGSGSWTLTGANVQTGATRVTEGTLFVNGSIAAASAVSVANDATLGGTGTVFGAVSVASGGTLAPGGPNANGTFTLGSAVLGTARLVFDLQDPANGPSDRLVVTGALTTAGLPTVALNLPAEGLPAGIYTLATYASRSGSFVLEEAYPDMLLAVGKTNLTLTVFTPGAVTELTWTGATSAVWDFGTANWSPDETLYADGLNVTFDDSGAASAPVTIPAAVAPNHATFNTTNNAYTLIATGDAGLSGDAWLIKRGPATLTLEGTHTHTGSTVVEEGVFNLAGALTASPLAIGKDATLDQDASSSIAGGTVSLVVQGRASLRGTNTYDGETVAGCVGEYNRNITVFNNLALGSTAAGTTVIGGHAMNHNSVILATDVTVTGETLTLTGNGRASLAYNASGSATWDGDIVAAPGALAFINCNAVDGTIILGTPGTAAVITGDADVQFRENGTIICNSRILLDGHSIHRNNRGILVLNSTNNVLSTCNLSEGTLRLGADNALPATVTVSMGKGDSNPSNKAYFDLNGHTQTITRFNENHYAAFNDNQAGCQCITSTLPATLIFGGAATNTFLKRNSDIRGAVTVVQAGPGILEFGQTNFTSGAFAVSNGVLRLNAAGGSVGPNCTTVTVAGGTLDLQNDAALSPAVNVTFAEGGTGVINILSGVNVTASTLWLGDKQKRGGSWGGSGSGAQHVDDTHFTGTGTLTVLHDTGGTLMSLQ